MRNDSEWPAGKNFAPDACVSFVSGTINVSRCTTYCTHCLTPITHMSMGPISFLSLSSQSILSHLAVSTLFFSSFTRRRPVMFLLRGHCSPPLQGLAGRRARVPQARGCHGCLQFGDAMASLVLINLGTPWPHRVQPSLMKC